MKKLGFQIIDMGVESIVTLLNEKSFTFHDFSLKFVKDEPQQVKTSTIKAIVGDYDHPHYEIVIKSQVNYRSFELTVKKQDPPKAKTATAKKAEEVYKTAEPEFPALTTCQAKTKAGQACKREPMDNGFCSLHQPKKKKGDK